MTESHKRGRSPTFPYITLDASLKRVEKMEKQHKNFPALIPAVGQTWGLGAKSSGLLQTVATLFAFGLITSQGRKAERRIQVSSLARTIIYDKRPGERERAIREVALKPPLLREYAQKWKTGRPADEHCVSELSFDRGFTLSAAKRFLRVFDDAFQIAKLGDIDDEADTETDGNADYEGGTSGDGYPENESADETPHPQGRSVAGLHEKAIAGEVLLASGLLSKTVSFRLLVTGDIGASEIERLKSILDVNKEFLTEGSSDSSDKPDDTQNDSQETSQEKNGGQGG